MTSPRLAKLIEEGLPFVLLDGWSSRPPVLYSSPEELFGARTLDEVEPCLERMGRSPGVVLCVISYEAGRALEPKLRTLGEPGSAMPLVWAARFARCDMVDPGSWLFPAEGAWSSVPAPTISRDDYEGKVSQVLERIVAGEIYQANLTFAAQVRFAGHPAALYAGLRQRARAPWGALVFTGAHWLLSLSPELFFTIEGREITARPMKGTAPPDVAPAELRDNPKQRAENLMIVDLLRNDLAKVTKPGSVRVPRLFEVERYPTVLQMTSTITAELREGIAPVDVLRELFPCGSITGAPKIQAEQVLHGLEKTPRGPYTGSIGRFDGGDAAFNVAIRTLCLAEGDQVATLGLGSGIVADSEPAAEWRECIAKGTFAQTGPAFDLIETMFLCPRTGVRNVRRHLARMRRSADLFGYRFDEVSASEQLRRAAAAQSKPARARLALSPAGGLKLDLQPLPADPSEPVAATLLPLPVDCRDFRLSHKTSDRRFYDDAREKAGVFEVVFIDPAGFVTEGSRTNVFVQRGEIMVTPPVRRGLLPGILREVLIEEGKAVEADIRVSDLQAGFWIGNSLRGLLNARVRSNEAII